MHRIVSQCFHMNRNKTYSIERIKHGCICTYKQSWSKTMFSSNAVTDMKLVSIGLNKVIMEQNNVQSILAIYLTNHDKFDAINLITCIKCIGNLRRKGKYGKIQSNEEREALMYLYIECCKRINSFEPSQLSQMLLGSAQCRVGFTSEMLLIINKVLSQYLSLLTHTQLSSVTWSLAKMNGLDANICHELSTEILNRNLSLFKEKELVNILWALSTKKYIRHTNGMFEHIGNYLKSIQLSSFSSKELDSIEWSYNNVGRLRLIRYLLRGHFTTIAIDLNKLIVGQSTGKDIVDIYAKHGKKYNHINLATTIYYLGSFGEVTDAEISNHVKDLYQQCIKLFDTFEPSSITTLLTGSIKTGILLPNILSNMIVSKVINEVLLFNSSQLITICWSYSKRERVDVKLYETIETAICQRDLGELSNNSLSKLLKTYSVVRSNTSPIFTKIETEILNRPVSSFVPYEISTIECIFDSVNKSDTSSIIRRKYMNAEHMTKVININEALKNLDSHETILTFYEERGKEFNNMNFTTLLFKLGSFGKVLSTENIDKVSHIYKECHSRIDSFKPVQLSFLVWCAAKTEVTLPNNTWKKVAFEICRPTSAFKPQEISIILYSFAKCNTYHFPVFDVFEKAIMNRPLSDFNSHELTNITWSYVKAKRFESQILELLAQEILTRGSEKFTEIEISTLKWSFKTLNKISMESFFDPPKCLVDRREQYMAVNKGTVVDEKVLKLKDAHSIFEYFTCNEEKLNGITIVTLIYRLGRFCDISSAEECVTVKRMYEVCEPYISTLKPQGIANLLLGSVKIKVPMKEKMWEAISDAVTLKSSTFNSQDISNILWSFIKWDKVDPSVVCALSDRIRHSNLNNFKPQEIAVIMWCLTSPNMNKEIDVIRTIEHHLQSRDLSLFNPQSLVMVARAIAKVPDLWTSVVLTSIETQIITRGLGDFNSQDICNLVSAFTYSQNVRSPIFKVIVEDIYIRNLSQFSIEGLSLLLSGFFKSMTLDKVLEDKLTQELLDRGIVKEYVNKKEEKIATEIEKYFLSDDESEDAFIPVQNVNHVIEM